MHSRAEAVSQEEFQTVGWQKVIRQVLLNAVLHTPTVLPCPANVYRVRPKYLRKVQYLVQSTKHVLTQGLFYKCL